MHTKTSLAKTIGLRVWQIRGFSYAPESCYEGHLLVDIQIKANGTISTSEVVLLEDEVLFIDRISR